MRWVHLPSSRHCQQALSFPTMLSSARFPSSSRIPSLPTSNPIASKSLSVMDHWPAAVLTKVLSAADAAAAPLSSVLVSASLDAFASSQAAISLIPTSFSACAADVISAQQMTKLSAPLVTTPKFRSSQRASTNYIIFLFFRKANLLLQKNRRSSCSPKPWRGQKRTAFKKLQEI